MQVLMVAMHDNPLRSGGSVCVLAQRRAAEGASGWFPTDGEKKEYSGLFHGTRLGIVRRVREAPGVPLRRRQS